MTLPPENLDVLLRAIEGGAFDDIAAAYFDSEACSEAERRSCERLEERARDLFNVVLEGVADWRSLPIADFQRQDAVRVLNALGNRYDETAS